MKMWTARISRPSAPSAWVVVVAAALVLTDSASASGGVQSLYTDKDHVLELDINTFNGSVYHQPRAFFVEFYASWCGHCIHYKPTWVKFATQIRRWNSTVQATVVNCADEKNSPLCREHAIAAFPTVKVSDNFVVSCFCGKPQNFLDFYRNLGVQSKFCTKIKL